jgi:endo-1,4-beta-xylanase
MITEFDLDAIPAALAGSMAVNTARTRALESAHQWLPGSGAGAAGGSIPKLFALFRRHADAIARISFWDLHDGRSWLNHFPWERANHPPSLIATSGPSRLRCGMQMP